MEVGLMKVDICSNGRGPIDVAAGPDVNDSSNGDEGPVSIVFVPGVIDPLVGDGVTQSGATQHGATQHRCYARYLSNK